MYLYAASLRLHVLQTWNGVLGRRSARRLEGVGGVTLAETRLILSWRGRETEVDSLA